MEITKRMKFVIREAVFSSMVECGSCGEHHPRGIICDCRNDSYRYHPEDLANVLFAAPDLLEACELASKVLEEVDMWRCDLTMEQINDIEVVEGSVNEAISKAKGGE